MKGGVSKKRPFVLDSDEDEESEPKKKPKLEDTLGMVFEELTSIKESVEEALTKDTKDPARSKTNDERDL